MPTLRRIVIAFSLRSAATRPSAAGAARQRRPVAPTAAGAHLPGGRAAAFSGPTASDAVSQRSPGTREEAGVRWWRDSGQAAAELVALLPVLVGLLACAWQVVLAGHAVIAAGAAARAAARAQAIGLDAPAAARAHLPAHLERGLRVAAREDGGVEVAVRIPTLPGLPPVGHATATARFDPQR